MHFHTYVRKINLEKIGIFEEDGQIVGVVNMELNERNVYFQVRQNYEHIKPSMFDYAEENFQGISQSIGKRIRGLYIHEDDQPLLKMAQSGGYEHRDDFDDHYSQYHFDNPIPKTPLPEGFRIISLVEESDFRKINEVLWAGFNHDGPAPKKEIEGRRFAQQAPNFNKELTIVVIDPDGNYISYCGMWFVPQNNFVYIEPVATIPNYRRMGFGKAAVLESMRRAHSWGAEIAWVGSDLEFYKELGFETTFKFEAWVKVLD
jgi:predicted N-acetyltransferase YhbS